MKTKIQLSASGIPLVDKEWGGFYRGGTYLLIGQKKSGRTILSLQYALEHAKRDEVCLFFTSARPKDLIIHAASIDVDLELYMNQNQIIVVRVTPPAGNSDSATSDDFLIGYLKDLMAVVEEYEPDSIVFDELTPFIGFDNSELLEEVFLKTSEAISDLGITSLFVLSDPANPPAKKLVDSLVAYANGVVFIEKKELEKEGIMKITPNIGHNEGKFESKYFIKPYKGIFIDEHKSNSVNADSINYQGNGNGNGNVKHIVVENTKKVNL